MTNREEYLNNLSNNELACLISGDVRYCMSCPITVKNKGIFEPCINDIDPCWLKISNWLGEDAN